jgi:fructose-1-phosphate kinase PfkB-like protein
MADPIQTVITVALNTAIDRILEVKGFKVGAHARGRELSRFPAGKAINVSRALARLGQPSISTGFVGKAELDQFEGFMEATGPGRIVCQLLSVRGKTRENVTIIDPVAHTDTHIRDAGFQVVNSDVQRMLTKIGLLARPNTIIVISGSLPPGMDVHSLNLLLTVAISGGARVVLDVGGPLLNQLATGMLPPDATNGAESPADVPLLGDPDSSGGIWMVKPNRQELADMIGVVKLESEEQIVKAARRLARVINYVPITLGADGAFLVTRDQVLRGRLAIDPQRITNTVGCGDCMVAGMIDAHLHGASSEQMLRRGMAVATANALREGIAEFRMEQIKSLEDLAVIEPYD